MLIRQGLILSVGRKYRTGTSAAVQRFGKVAIRVQEVLQLCGHSASSARLVTNRFEAGRECHRWRRSQAADPGAAANIGEVETAWVTALREMPPPFLVCLPGRVVKNSPSQSFRARNGGLLARHLSHLDGQRAILRHFLVSCEGLGQDSGARCTSFFALENPDRSASRQWDRWHSGASRNGF